jgi:thiol-activated cytolysin
MAACFLLACGGSEDAPPVPAPEPPAPTNPDGGLLTGDHLADLGKQPEAPVGAPHDQTISYPDGSQWSCTVQHYAMKDDPESFVTLNPTAAVVWPGSLVQGGSLAGGSPEPIAVPRAGGTVLLNLVNSGGGAAAKTYQVKLDEITQGNVVDAQNRILSNNVGSTPAAFSFEFHKVDSKSR